jgi:gamma-F420-2:alpha-L-glutamate ligase
VAGIDILFDGDGYRVCEANSAPGFQGLEKACGISVPEEIFKVMRKKRGLSVVARHTPWQRLVQGAQEYFADAMQPQRYL